MKTLYLASLLLALSSLTCCLAQADSCTSATFGLLGACGGFVTAAGQSAKTLGDSPTDQQVATATASINPQPSADCCSYYQNNYLAPGCNCDAAVIALSSAQGNTPQQTKIQTLEYKTACKIPPGIDKCA